MDNLLVFINVMESEIDTQSTENVTRGRLKKENGGSHYHIIEDGSPRGLNKSLAHLIQKIYEVDPLDFLKNFFCSTFFLIFTMTGGHFCLR